MIDKVFSIFAGQHSRLTDTKDSCNAEIAGGEQESNLPGSSSVRFTV
jgi:hypothetical protein